MNGIGDVIRQLESQKAAIERALEALRHVDGNEAPAAAPSSANDRRSAAQKKRWAARREAEATPAMAVRKSGMTPEGRKRLAEAMKRRWAAKRSAAQAKKRPGRPKKAA